MNGIRENNRYRAQVVFENRRGMFTLSLSMLILSSAFLLLQIFSPWTQTNTDDHLLYLFLFASCALVGGVSAIYPLVYRHRELNFPFEASLQMGIVLFFLTASVIFALLNIQYGKTITPVFFMPLYIFVLVRPRRIPYLVVCGVGIFVVFLGLLANKTAFSGGEYIELLMFIALISALIVVRDRERMTRHTLEQQLAEQSIVDPLTDVYNRRFFIEELERTLQRSLRYGHVFCLAMIDLDDFGRINEKLGHPAGDSILEASAWILLDQLRQSDVVARYGPDVFAVILSETAMSDAVDVLERVRNYFAGQPMFGAEEHLTCSIGLVECNASSSTNELLQEAEQMLLRSKAAGKNQVST